MSEHTRELEQGRSFATPDESELGHVLLRERARGLLFGRSMPQRIGRFEVDRKLGSGGMGEVYLARDDELRRPVAVKLLHAHLLVEGKPTAVQRSQREAQALARVSHPNIVEVFEVGEHEGRPFVAMEYVDGQTLAEWLRDTQPDWKAIVAMFVEAGRGLLAVHRAGLVHRDFKPDNVLISGNDTNGTRRVRVLDFGLARAGTDEELLLDSITKHSDEQLTDAGTLLGTPAFMSPEQLEGRTATEASDQFSFCLALHGALWGGDPFERGTIERRVASIMRGQPTKPNARGRPGRLWPIIRRGLAYEQRERWPDMAALLDELEGVMRVDQRGWWTATATVALALGLGLGLGLDRETTPATEPCAHVHVRAAELWTPTLAARTTALANSSSAPSAVDVVTRVDHELERWTSAWTRRRLTLRNANEGLAELQRASEIWRTDPQQSDIELGNVEVVLATATLTLGDLETAEHHAANARRLYAASLPSNDPTHAQPLLLEAQIAYQRNDPATALGLFARALAQLDSSNFDAHLAQIEESRAYCLRGLGREQEAQAIFEAHDSHDPTAAP